MQTLRSSARTTRVLRISKYNTWSLNVQAPTVSMHTAVIAVDFSSSHFRERLLLAHGIARHYSCVATAPASKIRVLEVALFEDYWPL